jgi:hypothetical protein
VSLDEPLHEGPRLLDLIFRAHHATVRPR